VELELNGSTEARTCYGFEDDPFFKKRGIMLSGRLFNE
jgi:hypothetical protein